MKQLEVKASKSQIVLVILLGIIFIPLGMGSILNGLLSGFEIVPLGIGVMCLVMFGVIVWIVLRARRKSVKYLSEEGLVRNDGQTFEWSELSRVVDKMRIRPSGKKFLWRTEIWFKAGESAWVSPQRSVITPKVAKLVRCLPGEHTEEKA